MSSSPLKAFEFSAASDSLNDIKSVLEKRYKNNEKVILFVDEIHRFSKTQQEYLLDILDRDMVVLLGATTENPSFNLTRALMSRCLVLTLAKHGLEEIKTVLIRGATVLNGDRIEERKQALLISDLGFEYLAKRSNGDLRAALKLLEVVFVFFEGEKGEGGNLEGDADSDEEVEELVKQEVKVEEGEATVKEEGDAKVKEEGDATVKEEVKEGGKEESEGEMETVEAKVQEAAIKIPSSTLEKALDNYKSSFSLINYDQKADGHYDTISALHKSVRGSDPNAAVYYLMRMIKGGDDPLFICRRMIRMSVEDIGLADTSCLGYCCSVYETVLKFGVPKGLKVMIECVIRLAKSPKSVELYRAWKSAKRIVDEGKEGGKVFIGRHLGDVEDYDSDGDEDSDEFDGHGFYR